MVKAGLKRLQFPDKNIHVLLDPEFGDISMALKKINLEIEQLLLEEGIQTLLFSYFGGHGAMDQFTKCVLNGPRMYPLEK